MNGFDPLAGAYTPGGHPSPYVQETAPYTTFPEPYIPDVQLPQQLQPPVLPQPVLPPSPPHIPDVELPPTLQPTLQMPGLEEKFGEYAEQPTVYEEAFVIPEGQPPSGPLEFVGDVIGNTVEFAGDVLKTGLDVIWDTGKFILEHLEVGIKYAGDISGTAAQRRYYEELGEAQKTAAEAAETRAKAYAQLVARGEMSQEEALARSMAYGMETQKGLTIDQPVIYETPAAKQLSDYMPLAIAGIAAILLLKKGKI